MVSMWKLCAVSLLVGSQGLKSPRSVSRLQSCVSMSKRKPAAVATSVPGIVPVGENQEAYVRALNDANVSMVFGTGPAGCGKTLFACYAAIDALNRQEVRKIVLTRPVVSVEEELGFLPGNIQRKMDPWLQPLFDVFLEKVSQRELDQMIDQGRIEISPLGFMRGRTFKQCFVIADEMQNSSPGQMLMMLTRIGENSKMVVTGDVHQSDLDTSSTHRYSTNGLADFLNKYQALQRQNLPAHESYIRWVQMNATDVKRSPVVREILSMYAPSPKATDSPPPGQNSTLSMNQHLEAQSKLWTKNTYETDAAMDPHGNATRRSL